MEAKCPQPHDTTRSNLRSAIRAVEFEVNSRCNRRCSYCPVSILQKETAAIPKLVDTRVVDRVLGALGEIEFEGRLSYHFLNEPLLHKNLEHIVAKAARMVPGCHQVLFTNGDLLTEKRYASLRAAGIEYVVVTSHSGKQHPPRPNQIVQFADDLRLTNRGGVLSHLESANGQFLTAPCYAPSEMLIVTVTGDVLLCYEDSLRKHVMGNLMTQSLEEIWYSENFTAVRELLEKGARSDAAEICGKCSNRVHDAPDRTAHSEPFWDELRVTW